MALYPDYSAAWRDLGRRRRLMWILFLGYVPGVALLCFVLARYQEGLCARIAIAWMLVMGIAIAWAASFRCPGCRGLFCFAASGANPAGSSIVARQCARCGLEMDERPAEPARE